MDSINLNLDQSFSHAKQQRFCCRQVEEKVKTCTWECECVRLCSETSLSTSLFAWQRCFLSPSLYCQKTVNFLTRPGWKEKLDWFQGNLLPSIHVHTPPYSLQTSSNVPSTNALSWTLVYVNSGLREQGGQKSLFSEEHQQLLGKYWHLLKRKGLYLFQQGQESSTCTSLVGSQNKIFCRI